MVKAAYDPKDAQSHNSAAVSGGLRSGGIGLGVALAASVAAQRFNVRAYRSLTLPLKAFAVTSATTASFIIGADAAARKFELDKYAVGSGTALEHESRLSTDAERAAGILQGVRADSRTGPVEKISTKDLLVEWGKQNRYSVVFGAWAASMIGSFGYISMTPLSFAQKLVQARMVAQGLTVVVLIASAGLSSIPNSLGVNEDELKREAREESMYNWKKGSPHSKAHTHTAVAVTPESSS